MTPQEQEMIDGLTSRIRNTPVTDKDIAAEQRLQQGLAGSPDALYVLAQTVLVQQYGLQQAQAQLSDLNQQNQALQEQLQQASQNKSSGGGFLSHIFGGGSGSQQSQAPSYQPVNNPGYGQPGSGQPGSGQPGYGQNYTGGGYPPPPAVYPPQGYPAPPSRGGFGGGGFLSGALQTAAGVAAGEMMFQGMEGLFHGFEHGGGGGGYGSGFTGAGGGGETVVNNYYDDDNGRDRGERGDAGRDDSSFYNPSDDASRNDLAGSTPQFADTGSDAGSGQDFGTESDASGDDMNNGFDGGGGMDDNSGFDNGGMDDSSGFDDGGGNDMGGGGF